MRRIKNLLVPIDFSNRADNALDYAIEFAKMAHSKLFIFHAYHLPVSTVGAAYPYSGPYVDEIEKEINEKFAKIKEEKIDEAKLDATFISNLGLVEETIEPVIQEKEIDLVIMGTHGGSAVEELMGSTTTDLFRKASTPVLAIPENVKFNKIKNVLFATDYQNLGKPTSFNILIELSELFGAEIKVLNVKEEGQMLNEEDTAAGIILDEYLHRVKHTFHISIKDNVEEGINEYIANNNVDLLAMMPRKHNIFERLFKGSLTNKMAFQSKIPLLAFHE